MTPIRFLSRQFIVRHLFSVRCLKRLLVFVSFILSLTPRLSASIFSQDSVIYQAETRATFSGGANTPFWLVSNLHGLGSPELNNGFLRAKIIKPISIQKKLSLGGGADLVGGWHQPAIFRIQQLYAELKYRSFWMSFGSREFSADYNHPYLSSGDLLFSGNAMPIPQLRIGTYGFAPFWGTKGWFSVKAFLSYGKFTDSRWQKHWASPGAQRTSGVLFCGRGIWFRIGNKEKYPLTFDFGAVMATQFAGTIYKDNKTIKMPNRFIDWIKAFIPAAGSPDTPEDEQTNVQGNMNGEYNISLSYSPNHEWDIRLYYDHYFEDHSQMFFEYGVWKDGLWGIEIKFPENKIISKFVYEFITTKDQTGSILHNSIPEIPEQVSGQDAYFSHYLYGSWQTWGMTLGTPLAISPLYNKDHVLYLYDTRFTASHIGLEGKPLKDLKWRILLTFSRNWGTYYRPLPDIWNNFSGLLELDYHPCILKGWYAKAGLGLDRGKLLGNNFGGMLTIGFEGDFSLKK